jgi:pyruvate dehydrogenase E1 component alpha subunit
MANLLGDLLNPDKYHEPINISGFDTNDLMDDLKQMYVIRRVEEIIAENKVMGVIKCPCHLGIGQEATAVGLSRYLRSSDRVFGGHRSHTHYLGLRGSVYKLFAETLGRLDGCSKGMGGSMHLYDPSIGFGGSVTIVGASVPIATGAALAAKKDKLGDIAVSYLGDSACEEGAVQESFNLASIMKLPIIFVVENNLFASHMHIDLRQPHNSTARFAEAHGIPFKVIDGNNLTDIYEASQEAVKYCRENKGPYFIEAMTYRWRGHVGPREDTDVGVKRKDDLNKWKKRDPIRRLKDALINKNIFSEKDFNEITKSIDKELDNQWNKALKAPFPSKNLLKEIVYK